MERICKNCKGMFNATNNKQKFCGKSECVKVSKHEYYLKNKSKIKEKTRAWKEDNRDRYNKTTNKRRKLLYSNGVNVRERYNLKNPKKIKAHVILNNFKRYNKEKFPNFCCVCGSDNNIESHHDDYKLPLRIYVLCKKCHVALHNNRIELKKEWRVDLEKI